MDPCASATCADVPDAVCVANYCGGCNAQFYDYNGDPTNCTSRNMLNLYYMYI